MRRRLLDLRSPGSAAAIGLLSGGLLAGPSPVSGPPESISLAPAIEGLILEQDGRIRSQSGAVRNGGYPGRRARRPGADQPDPRPELTAFEPAGEYDLLQADGGSRVVEVLWREAVPWQPHRRRPRAVCRELRSAPAATSRAVRSADRPRQHRDVRASSGQGAGLVRPGDRRGRGAVKSNWTGSTACATPSARSASDQIIIHAAQRLQRCVRDTDTVARLGPETFAMIQPLVDRPSTRRCWRNG